MELKKKDINILVVDDDEDMCEVIAIHLQKRGYNVVTASSGAEAIETVKKERFSLILIDLKMPGISGVDTIREIRKMDPAVPIVIITGTHEQVDRSVDHEVYCYIYKPFKLAKIREVIQQILNEKASEPEGK